MGQRGGGVFFMLTFSQPAYSFIEPLHERVGTSLNLTLHFFPVLTLSLTCLPQNVRGEVTLQALWRKKENTEKQRAVMAVTSFYKIVFLTIPAAKLIPRIELKGKKNKKKHFQKHIANHIKLFVF